MMKTFHSCRVATTIEQSTFRNVRTHHIATVSQMTMTTICASTAATRPMACCHAAAAPCTIPTSKCRITTSARAYVRTTFCPLPTPIVWKVGIGGSIQGSNIPLCSFVCLPEHRLATPGTSVCGVTVLRREAQHRASLMQTFPTPPKSGSWKAIFYLNFFLDCLDCLGKF